MMKKHLLLLLVLTAALLSSHRSIAQPYQSIFGKDSTMWTALTHCPPMGGGVWKLPYVWSNRSERKILLDNYQLVFCSTA